MRVDDMRQAQILCWPQTRCTRRCRRHARRRRCLCPACRSQRDRRRTRDQSSNRVERSSDVSIRARCFDGNPAARHSGNPSRSRRARRPSGSQDLDGAIRVHAVGSAAVRRRILPLGQATQLLLQRIDWKGERASNVTGGVFVCGPGIEHDDILRPRSFQEVAHLHGLGVASGRRNARERDVPSRRADVRQPFGSPWTDRRRSGSDRR